MPALPRNPRGASSSVPPSGGSFPGSPEFGQVYGHTGFGATFRWDGSRWQVADGGGAIYPAGAGVLAFKAVVLISGQLERLDASVHTRATGVVASMVGGSALVRWLGEIDGLSGLVANTVYYGSAAPGVMSSTDNPTLNQLRLGVGVTTTRFFVSVEAPVLA